MAKYGSKAQKKVSKVMHEYGEGKLKSGSSGKKVKNRKQAIAIGISEARREGDKVPSRKSSSKSRSSSKKSGGSKKSSGSSKSRSSKSKRSSSKKSSKSRSSGSRKSSKSSSKKK